MFLIFFIITQENILTHDEINKMFLKEKFSKYFDPIKDIRKNYNWVINPFV